jgi:hypothetical protein
MADTTPRVIEATDTTIYDRATNKTRQMRRTLFMVGSLGPFVVEIPVDEFTEYKLREAMDATARAYSPHV